MQGRGGRDLYQQVPRRVTTSWRDRQQPCLRTDESPLGAQDRPLHRVGFTQCASSKKRLVTGCLDLGRNLPREDLVTLLTPGFS
jgi:hypothetical protein